MQDLQVEKESCFNQVRLVHSNDHHHPQDLNGLIPENLCFDHIITMVDGLGALLNRATSILGIAICPARQTELCWVSHWP
jgi:hypothetical protein